MFTMMSSLRTKLMLLLIVVTTLMLIAYGGLALTDFSKDKIAYVYGTLFSQSKGLSSQLHSELDFLIDQVRFYMRGYDFDQQKFHAYSRVNFKQDHRIEKIWSFAEGKNFQLKNSKDRLGDGETPKGELEEIDRSINSIFQQIVHDKVSVKILQTSPGKWLVGLLFDEQGKSRSRTYVVALIKKGYFVEQVISAQMQDSFLLNSKNKIIVSPFEPIQVKNSEQAEQVIKASELDQKGKSGVFEVKDADKNSWLVSVSDVGVGGLKVFSLVSKEMAMSAVKVILVKSLFFVIFLLCITIIVSVLSSKKLTQSLKVLLESTRKIADGNFLVKTKVQTNDEVGALAQGFNLMTVEIQRLMLETAEKARMESELLTARTVQSTLFPEAKFSVPGLEIMGNYEPASECGGDWFYYLQQGAKVYTLIGDATGHGVPAALVTSAAKSASRVIEEFPGIDLADIAGILNRAVYETAKGKVMMTFFLGHFDTETSEFTYVNASHDPPFLIPGKGSSLSKNDINPLMGETCKRLGEDLKAVYVKQSIAIQPGDKIIFYTDGVTELMNSEKKMWGEGRFIRSLVRSFNAHPDISHAMDDLQISINNHRQDHPLDDDVTYFMMQRMS